MYEDFVRIKRSLSDIDYQHRQLTMLLDRIVRYDCVNDPLREHMMNVVGFFDKYSHDLGGK